ncbi:hypothetical protein [Streptomyces sp. WAC07149]|uniref:hypothetical protein n=1 Tax=Streptomyces sp. WAC07149 TaxID=2487425 RepID=UPI0021AF38B0|nr:hypothetical protein [Streptomyces sp. WAC07149]
MSSTARHPAPSSRPAASTARSASALRSTGSRRWAASTAYGWQDTDPSRLCHGVERDVPRTELMV